MTPSALPVRAAEPMYMSVMQMLIAIMASSPPRIEWLVTGPVGAVPGAGGIAIRQPTIMGDRSEERCSEVACCSRTPCRLRTSTVMARGKS